jgi:hypothetical protein
MTEQEKMLSQKKRGRKPTGRNLLIGVRIPSDMLEGLDAAIEASEDQPGRPKMIRRIIADWLAKRGFLQPLKTRDRK